jgi:hypothetical protein
MVERVEVHQQVVIVAVVAVEVAVISPVEQEMSPLMETV